MYTEKSTRQNNKKKNQGHFFTLIFHNVIFAMCNWIPHFFLLAGCFLTRHNISNMGICFAIHNIKYVLYFLRSHCLYHHKAESPSHPPGYYGLSQFIFDTMSHLSNNNVFLEKGPHMIASTFSHMTSTSRFIFTWTHHPAFL